MGLIITRQVNDNATKIKQKGKTQKCIEHANKQSRSSALHTTV